MHSYYQQTACVERWVSAIASVSIMASPVPLPVVVLQRRSVVHPRPVGVAAGSVTTTNAVLAASRCRLSCYRAYRYCVTGGILHTEPYHRGFPATLTECSSRTDGVLSSGVTIVAAFVCVL